MYTYLFNKNTKRDIQNNQIKKKYMWRQNFIRFRIFQIHFRWILYIKFTSRGYFLNINANLEEWVNTYKDDYWTSFSCATSKTSRTTSPRTAWDWTFTFFKGIGALNINEVKGKLDKLSFSNMSQTIISHNPFINGFNGSCFGKGDKEQDCDK